MSTGKAKVVSGSSKSIRRYVYIRLIFASLRARIRISYLRFRQKYLNSKVDDFKAFYGNAPSSKEKIRCPRCNKLTTKTNYIMGEILCSQCTVKVMNNTGNTKGIRHRGKIPYKKLSRSQLAQKYRARENESTAST